MQQKKRSNFQGVSANSESFLSAKVKAIFFCCLTQIRQEGHLTDAPFTLTEHMQLFDEITVL